LLLEVLSPLLTLIVEVLTKEELLVFETERELETVAVEVFVESDPVVSFEEDNVIIDAIPTVVSFTFRSFIIFAVPLTSPVSIDPSPVLLLESLSPDVVWTSAEFSISASLEFVISAVFAKLVELVFVESAPVVLFELVDETSPEPISITVVLELSDKDPLLKLASELASPVTTCPDPVLLLDEFSPVSASSSWLLSMFAEFESSTVISLVTVLLEVFVESAPVVSFSEVKDEVLSLPTETKLVCLQFHLLLCHLLCFH